MITFGNEAVLSIKEFNKFINDNDFGDDNICINDREYEAFVEKHASGNFLQSQDWGKVKKGWITERVVVRDENGEIKASMQVLIKKIPMLNISYMYAPRGPVCDYHDKDTLNKLMMEVDKLQKKYNVFAFKTDPLIEEGDRVAIENMKKIGMEYLVDKDGYDTVQCRSNYVLDIKNKSQEELFASFHRKHRYNIRLAERKGVVCRFYGKEKIDDFYALMIETGKRDGFQIRSKEYFEDILNEMGEKASLCMSYYNNIPISGALIINYGKTMSYLYGASSDSYREVMANYLMQWTCIKKAIENNCEIYDFMGIPFYYDEEHPNYGVYRFKKGFNGRVVNYAGEFEHLYYPVVGKIIIRVLNYFGYKI